MPQVSYLFPATGSGSLLARPGGSPAARILKASVLRTGPEGAGGALVLWSGSCAELEPDAQPGSSLFEPSPANWGPRGWSLLSDAVRHWVDADSGPSLLIRTHASHILSDPPSATQFAKRWAASGVRLAYDPVSMLTVEMAASTAAPDLYRRSIESLAHPDLQPGVGFVLICNAQLDGARVLPAPIDSGLLQPDLIRSALNLCESLGLPIARLDTDPAADLPRYTPPPPT